MIERDYSEINGKYNELPSDIRLIIESNMSHLTEELEYSNVQLRKIKSPFIMADNDFDLRECNNTFGKYNVDKVEQGSFTGGGIYIIYTTTSTGIIVQGNGEEGYNVFVIEK